MDSKPFYELKASLTAMWLPAVVGDKKNMFLAASLSTLITKILMLLLSVILVYFFQEKVHSHPFVLWCRFDWSEVAVGNTTLCTFEGTNTTVTCFDNSDAGVQKIRQCGENE